jgi:hypothetical protein
MKRHPSDTSLRLTISIAGNQGLQKGLARCIHGHHHRHHHRLSIASYHDVCCLWKAKAWRVSSTSTNVWILPTALHVRQGLSSRPCAKSNRGVEALDLFHSLPESRRDVQAVLKTMTALIGMRDLETARQLVENHARMRP